MKEQQWWNDAKFGHSMNMKHTNTGGKGSRVHQTSNGSEVQGHSSKIPKFSLKSTQNRRIQNATQSLKSSFFIHFLSSKTNTPNIRRSSLSIPSLQ